jgi:thymidine kinase
VEEDGPGRYQQFVVRLPDTGNRVIIAGLDTDYLGGAAGRPRRDHQDPRHLYAMLQSGQTHAEAVGSEDLIAVGAAGMYEARCRRCFEPNLVAEEAEKRKKAAVTAGVSCQLTRINSNQSMPQAMLK